MDGDAARAQPVFFYDLASPSCWLVAERVNTALPHVPEWVPVHGLPAGGDDRALVEARAAELGLPAIRWPAPWPPDGALAARAATWARQLGRAVAFSLAAFRQAYAAGRDLDDLDTILIAFAACELHPRAVQQGIERPAVRSDLAAAGDRARALGVRQVPALAWGGAVHAGQAAVDAVLAAERRP